MKSHSRVGTVLLRQISGLNSGGRHSESRTPEDINNQRHELMKKAQSESKNLTFAKMTADAALKELKVAAAEGLTAVEAEKRLVSAGRNELAKKPPPTALQMFLAQFTDPLVILLIVAAIVAGALAQFSACIVILTIVIGNALLGVKMEMGANNALEALANSNPPLCQARRDGLITEVQSALLVPGDIVILSTGASVPADMRIIVSNSCLAEEASLNGESMPAKKNEHYVSGQISEDHGGGEGALTEANMLYMGTTVVDGNAEGLVVQTGMNTIMGQTAYLMMNAEEGLSPIQEKIEAMSVRLGIASLSISLVVFVAGILRSWATKDTAAGCAPWHGWCPDPNDENSIFLQMLLIAVSLTVAAVPEGLPVCQTICFSNGMSIMANRHKAQITKLRNVETLGSASVICTDKTGTLTCGIMTAVRVFICGTTFRITGEGYIPEGNIGPEEVSDQDMAAASKALANGPHRLPILLGALNSPSVQLTFNKEEKQWEAVGNMSERPLVVASRKAGYTEDSLKTYPILAENTFDSKRKMMSTVHEVKQGAVDSAYFAQGASHLVIVKGAPNVVLDQCVQKLDLKGDFNASKNALPISPMTQEDKQKYLAQIDAFSAKAFRVLAIAYKTSTSAPADTTPATCEKGLTFAGLIASIDPERPEVKPVIKQAHHAGIRVVMITGDYVLTARAIAKNIGILSASAPEATSAIDCAVIRPYGDKITELRMKLEDSEKQLSKEEKKSLEAELATTMEAVDVIIDKADVYARARPIDKITIVNSLQRRGNVCSMTGDGVNDAPALKQANIGVAMGITGTDAAKAAADMILLDDNFVSIYHAIRMGRVIYADMTKFIFFLLSTNISEVFSILLTVLVGLPIPLTAIQILYLNLATDGFPAVALAVEEGEAGIMDEGPRPRTEPLIEKVQLTGILIQTCVLTTLLFGTYVIGLTWHTGTWNGAVPDYDLCGTNTACATTLAKNYGDGVTKAQTMAILLIVLAELGRAYSSRSLRQSVFTIGFFSNPMMQYSVGASLTATSILAFTPGVMDLFGTAYLDARSYLLVIGAACIPFTVDEITKFFYRKYGFGLRPKMNDYSREEN